MCDLFVTTRHQRVNNRVNYWIKRILIEMDNNQIIDMEDEVMKYCISAFSCMVSSYGRRQLVSFWNMHPVAVSKLGSIKVVD